MKKIPKFLYIYVITNCVTNKQYVGSKMCYLDNPEIDNYWGSSKYLRKDYELYGKNNFTKEILKTDCIDVNDMLNAETFFIIQYNTLQPNGYNRFLPNTRKGFHMGGLPKVAWNKGLSLTNEQKKNMNKPKSKDHADKVALTKIGNTYRKGSKCSTETCEQMSKSHLGLKHTKEHNANFSKARTGVSITPTLKMECPYCKKLIDKRNFSRWHGTNCSNYNES